MWKPLSLFAVLALLLACSEDTALSPANAPAGPQCSDWPIDSTTWHIDADTLIFTAYYQSPTPRNDCNVGRGNIAFYDDSALTRDHEIDPTRSRVLAVEYVFSTAWYISRSLVMSEWSISPGDGIWSTFSVNYGQGQGGACGSFCYLCCLFVDSLVVR